MASSTGFSIPLYRDSKEVWHQGIDGGGQIDVAAVEIERDSLPSTTVYRAFTPEHLYAAVDRVAIGTSLLIVGFPLGFHDALHHMPVVRHAVVASAFGLTREQIAWGHRTQVEHLYGHGPQFGRTP